MKGPRINNDEQAASQNTKHCKLQNLLLCRTNYFAEQIFIRLDIIYNHILSAQWRTHLNVMTLLFNMSAEQGFCT